MATSDLKTETAKPSEPTKQEEFKHNIAPEPVKSDPLDHDGNGVKGGVKKGEEPVKRGPGRPRKDTSEESPAIQRQQYQDEQEEEFRTQVEASRKGSPVDALGLPEGEGDELWANAVEIAPRDSETDEDGKPVKETDKAYDKRVAEGEAALVNGAIQFLSPLFGSLRPLGYNLTKTDTHIRLAIVNTEANPNPAKIGGKPNELGKY